MQDAFSMIPVPWAALERSLSASRLKRYFAVAGRDQNLAFRYYVWNADSCASFYFPLQITEIVIRNAIGEALARRYGPDWHQDKIFFSVLPSQNKQDLIKVCKKERKKQGARFTRDHVISSLSLGFWVSLTTTKFEHLLWNEGLCKYFPHLPDGVSLKVLHEALESVRVFRNRVAHYEAVFDKKPSAAFQNMQKIVGWVCSETLSIMNESSNVSQVINKRPRK